MKLKNNNGLNSFVFGLCFMLALNGAYAFGPKKEDRIGQVKKTRTIKQDNKVWRDTLFVLCSTPSHAGMGDDVWFTNRNGVRQKVCGMTENVTKVDYGDIVVIDEECKVIELLARNQKLKSFVKQK